MKYKKIYEVIYASNCSAVRDLSNWGKREKNRVEQIRPLWILLENRNVNLRVWVSHEFGSMQIETAQLDLHVDSKEYRDSRKRYNCRNQTEMAEKLQQLLRTDSQCDESLELAS